MTDPIRTRPLQERPLQKRPLQKMEERYPRPDWVRRTNAMADAVGGARRMVPLDPDELYEQATGSLGVEPPAEGSFGVTPPAEGSFGGTPPADGSFGGTPPAEGSFGGTPPAEGSFGGTPPAEGSARGELPGDFADPGWRARFDALVRALDATDMHVVGRLLTREELLRSLRTRLLLDRAWRDDPGIAGEPVTAPVIVTGPARSGTSILFELLWLDPSLRAPLAWEALHPLPRPGDPDEAVRAAASECEQELWGDVQPEFRAIHELRSDLPVECVTLTTACFCGPHWQMVAQMQGFADDPAEMYAFHRRILQVLQRGRPPRTWLLKTPGHLLTLDLLFATYPDAWIVQTHRDPAKTMPSTVSTTAMVQWLRTDSIDLSLLTAAIQGAFGFALNNVAERRAAGTLPKRFVDVHFEHLMRDPVAAIRAAYDAMGRPFSEEHAERIRAYLRDKPKGKFGTHQYAPEDWGLTAESLREGLRPYVEYFGVALE